MNEKLDRKRIAVYLVFACGIAWAGGLAIYLTGGLVNSPPVIGQITLALLLVAIVYMGAPALAHLLTRLVTGEGWQGVYLRPQLRRGWPYWIVCWIAPSLLTFLGAALFFVLFPQHFDPTMAMIRRLLQAQIPAGQGLPEVDPWMVAIGQTAVAVVLAPILNALPTFGEEFGWRAYLQPKLMPLGGRKAVVLTGVIWGVWHWPLIVMGHNYGFGYPGAPWLGMLAMVWFTLVLGTFLGWATLRAGSVWPAVIGHGAINGIAGIGAFFLQGQPNVLLGPFPSGLIGGIGFALVALVICWRPGALVPAGATSASAT